MAIRIPTEAEVAELVSVAGEIARGLAFERDMLREMLKDANRVIGLYRRWEQASDIEIEINNDSDIDSSSMLIEASFAANDFIEKWRKYVINNIK